MSYSDALPLRDKRSQMCPLEGECIISTTERFHSVKNVTVHRVVKYTTQELTFFKATWLDMMLSPSIVGINKTQA